MARYSRTFFAIVSALALVLSALPISPAIAQEVVTGSATGVSVTISNGWTHNAEASRSDGAVDSLVFERGSANFVVIAGTTDLSTATSLMALPGSVVDIDVAGTYALRQADDHGLFSVVVGGNVQTLIAPGPSFGEAMAAAQSSIQIDGAGVMSGVDGGALAGSFAASDADAPLLGSSGVTSSDEAVVEEATEEASVGDEEQAPVDADESLGLVDANTWVSPQFGTTVTWTDEWTVRRSPEGEPQIISSTAEGIQMDRIELAEVDGETADWVSVTIRPLSGGGFDPAASKAALAEPDPYYGTPYFAVDVSDTDYVHGTYMVDGTVATVSHVDTVTGKSIRVGTRSSFERLPDLVAAAQRGIQVDDAPTFPTVDVNQLRDQIDTEIEGLPEIQAQRNAELAELGLVEPNHFVSTSMACDVSWNESLRLGGEWNPFWFDDEDDFHVRGSVVSNERFALTSDTTETVPWVTCLSPVPSLESLTSWQKSNEDWWKSDSAGNMVPSYVAFIDGSQAFYVIGWSEFGRYDVTIVIGPNDGTAVEVSWSLTAAELDGLIASNDTPILVVNGVDVIKAMEEDGIRDHLP